MDFNIGDLPLDVQHNIFILSKHKTSEVYMNKGLNYSYMNDIRNNNALRTISNKELENYIEKYSPFAFCQFIYTNWKEYDVSYISGIIRKNTCVGSGLKYSYSYKKADIIECLKAHDPIEFGVEISVKWGLLDESPFAGIWRSGHEDGNNQCPLPENSIILCYDLITSYYILKERSQCKHFSKKIIIDSLNYLCEHANTQKILLYLWCNAMIMGIQIPNISDNGWVIGGYDDDDEKEKVIESMKLYIKLFYTKIIKYINIIDDIDHTNHDKNETFVMTDIVGYEIIKKKIFNHVNIFIYFCNVISLI
jgi:hypothetical protein